MQESPRLLFGADVLSAQPALLGAVQRAALVTNDAARSAAHPERRTRTALIHAGIPIVRLFSPEHGLSAGAADGAAVLDQLDRVTGLPVVSLYGERFAPPRDTLHDVDMVLFDIPGIGARFYTYLWTLTHVIDACAEAKVPLVVLDRPNPLGGMLEVAEGPMLDIAFASFIGRHSIPIRHSLTMAELALLWRNERVPEADVRVIQCEGWERDQMWPDTGLPFIPMSPAITRFEAALLYPGLCLFEATNLSVGRGTEFSFEVIGAPWFDAAAVSRKFNERGEPGLDVACIEFVPATGPYANETCRGIRLKPTAPRKVRPVHAGLALLADVIALHKSDFSWANYTTAANPGGLHHLERLMGVGGVREEMESEPEKMEAAVLDAWTKAPGWKKRVKPLLLY